MAERRVAANRVYTSPREYVSNHIVMLKDGAVTGLQPLACEQAHTEWLGGIVVITPLGEIGETDIQRIEDFYPDTGHSSRLSNGCHTQAPEASSPSAPFSAYHLSGIPADHFETDHTEAEKRIHFTKL